MEKFRDQKSVERAAFKLSLESHEQPSTDLHDLQNATYVAEQVPGGEDLTAVFLRVTVHVK